MKPPRPSERSELISLFLCGDVMTGRGIDQILPHPADPGLHEPFMSSARGYVELAERKNGRIEEPVDFSYIWGVALKEFERVNPDLKIINLETAITTSDEHWQDKTIHYRMSPANAQCLKVAGIDACSLANNHILDWGYSGLKDTLDTLSEIGAKRTGAGLNSQEATTPAVFQHGERTRVLLFSFGSPSSGIPLSWSATEERGGVCCISESSSSDLESAIDQITGVKQAGDVVLVSIHWGGNWGYAIPRKQIDFAHRLIDDAGVDLIHGHSSHHVKGFEVYQDRLILYGCGDFLNDYEGISGFEEFRSELGLMYFPSIDPVDGRLVHLQMTPTRIESFRINRASARDSAWLQETINRESERFAVHVDLTEQLNLIARWDQ